VNKRTLGRNGLKASELGLGSTPPVLLGSELVAQGGKDGAIRVLELTTARAAGGAQRRVAWEEQSGAGVH
jgi:hypothetical protein